MQKHLPGFLCTVIVVISFLIGRHICQGNAGVSGEPECKASRLGDLLVRVSEGKKELASIGSQVKWIYGARHIQDKEWGIVSFIPSV